MTATDSKAVDLLARADRLLAGYQTSYTGKLHRWREDYARWKRAARAGRPTSLIVEDHEGIRELLRDLLQALGAEVVEAWDAVGATAAWRRRREHGGFALAVLDNQFPAEKGLVTGSYAEPFAKLMRDETRVLVYSGDDALEPVCAELGVRFVSKGARFEELRATVEELLGLGGRTKGGSA